MTIPATIISQKEALARTGHANRQYQRARRQLIIRGACLSNSDIYGEHVLERNYNYFFETMWDDNEAIWLNAQEQAIGWASR